MKRYLSVWWLMTISGTQENLTSRLSAILLILGKIIRFLFFLLFLVVIGSKTKAIVGYTLSQVIFFYLTFQLIDNIPQFFMREVYRFRRYITSGDFDYFLTKPLSPLFRSLFGWTDALDIPIIMLSIIFLLVSVIRMPNVTFFGIITYFILLLNSFAIALSFHVLVLAMAIVTTEVDNAIMLYRDITQMGRLPVDIYKEPIRGLITFAIPVGIMMTVPAKALLGLLSTPVIIIAFIVSGLFLSVSLFFWRRALLDYSSASS